MTDLITYAIGKDDLCKMLEAAYVKGHNDCKTIDSAWESTFQWECNEMINAMLDRLNGWVTGHD